MAKIHEEVIVIKLSKLVKDNQDTEILATQDLADALTAVAEELAGAGVVVEVEQA
jgi:hypothetical protein